MFNKLDGRHKMAVVAALVCWALSMFFSYQGFKLDNSQLTFVGWILAAVVTVVELVFNSPTKRLSLTLIAAGVLCYGYGVYTNVEGFWTIQHPNVAFQFFSQKSIMSWFVGTLLEILPEPLLMWGLGSFVEGDLLGNLLGLWSGDLNYAQPDQPVVTSHPATQEHKPNQKPQYNPAQQKQGHNFPKDSLMNKPVNTNLASPIFNQKYIERLKKK